MRVCVGGGGRERGGAGEREVSKGRAPARGGTGRDGSPTDARPPQRGWGPAARQRAVRRHGVAPPHALASSSAQRCAPHLVQLAHGRVQLLRLVVHVLLDTQLLNLILQASQRAGSPRRGLGAGCVGEGDQLVHTRAHALGARPLLLKNFASIVQGSLHRAHWTRAARSSVEPPVYKAV